MKDQLGYNIKTGTRDVIIVFSSVDVPLGKFNGSKEFENNPATVIFVNCLNNSWYLEGIPRLGQSVDDSAKMLNDLVCNHISPGGKTLYYGGSMGGYGALLYGSINQADFIVSTGIELNFSKDNGYYSRLSKVPLPLKQPDINKLVANTNSKILLLFGECVIDDYIDIEPLGFFNNVSIVGIPHSEHSVPVMLNRIIGLNFFISHILENKNFEIVNTFKGELTQFPELIKAFINCSINDLESKRKAQHIIKNHLKNTNLESIKSYCHYYIGKINYDMGLIEKSIEHCKLAIFFNGNYKPPLQLTLKIYRDLGNKYEYKLAFERLLSINSYYPTSSQEFLLLQYAEGLFSLGLIDKCREIIKTLDFRIKRDERPLSKRLISLINCLENQKTNN